MHHPTTPAAILATAPRQSAARRAARAVRLAALLGACAALATGCNDGSGLVRVDASPGGGGGGGPGAVGDAPAPADPTDGPQGDTAPDPAPAAPASADAGAPDAPRADRPPADAPAPSYPQDDPAFVPAPGSFERLKLATRVGRVMAVDVAPNDDVLIAERDGALKIWKAGGELVTAGMLEVFTGNEDGFLGVILDPAFASNGWVYLLYTARNAPEQHLSRFELKNDRLVMASEKIVLKIPEDRDDCCHVGGGMDFDAQNNLYLSVGDNSDPFQSDGYAPIDSRPGREVFDAQRTSGNTNDLRGKILRIKPMPDASYTVPPGNLFARGGGCPEVYVMGTRNPFRIAVDRVNGWLYWGEVGPDACDGCDALGTRGPRGYDEFNQAKTAGNYGWPYCIADNKPYVAFDFASGQSGAPFDCRAPVNQSPNNTGARTLPPARPAWAHYSYGGSPWGSGGRSALAGAVYHWQPGGSPQKLPRAYDGSVFLMDYERGWIQRVTVDAQGASKSMERWLPDLSWDGLIGMRISASGVMVVAEYRDGGGAVYRVGYGATDRPPVAVATADVDSGPVPLAVRFSSAGSADPERRPLAYAWDFDGDGSTDSTDPSPTHTYDRAGLFTARLTVSDGASSALATVAIVAGNTRPLVRFVSPARGTFVAPGERVDYTVTVADAEDATASCATATVTPALGHDRHQHDGMPVTGCRGSITTATGLVPTENSWQLIDAAFTDPGVPPAPPLAGKAAVLMHFKHKEAEHFPYIGASSDLRTEPTADPTGGDLNVAYINDGSWICWDEMNFQNITSLTYRVASAGLGGRIEVRRGSPTGALVSTADVPVTGGWQSWTSVTAPVTDPGGTAKTCFVFRRNPGDQSLFNLNWIEFGGPGVSRP